MSVVSAATVAADSRTILVYLSVHGDQPKDTIIEGCELSGNRFRAAMQSLRRRKKVMATIYLTPPNKKGEQNV